MKFSMKIVFWYDAKPDSGMAANSVHTWQHSSWWRQGMATLCMVDSPHKWNVMKSFKLCFPCLSVTQKLSCWWFTMPWSSCDIIVMCRVVCKILSWWCGQMDTFSALLALCAGNSLFTSEFPAQRPVTRSFDVFFICAWINDWENNRKAGDLRRHLAHYDVIVMITSTFIGYATK